MRILLAYIRRSWQTAPLQPLLIMLTVALSVAVAVTSWTIGGIFSERADEFERHRTALGQIGVTMNADREIRMLFATDAEAIVGDSGRVLGEYTMTAFMPAAAGEGRRAVSFAATDLLEADAFFAFSYTDLIKIPEDRIRDAAIVSESFALQEDLAAGDSLTLEILGEDVTFLVCAVARDEGLLAERRLLVSRERIVGMLARYSPAISALGDSFSPSTRLMIQCEESRAEDLFLQISHADTFADCRVELYADVDTVNVNLLMQTASVWLLAVVLMTLSCFLILSAQSILLRKRRRDHALLGVAGASPAHMVGIALAESTALSFAGGVIGVLLAICITPWIGSFFVWHTSPVLVDPTGVITGLLLAIFLGDGCTLMSMRGQGSEPLAERLSDARYPIPSRPKTRRALACTLVTLVLALFTVLLPVENAYLAAIPTLVLSVFSIYLAFPVLFYGVILLLERWSVTWTRRSGVWMLAIRNLKNHASISHVARLWAVLVAMTVTVFFCGSVLADQERVMDNAVVGEVVAVGVPDSAIENLNQSPAVAGVATLWSDENARINDRYTAIVIALAGDVATCASADFLPTELPGEDEAVVSAGMAALLNVGIGDRIAVDVQGYERILTVRSIQHSHFNMVFVSPSIFKTAHPITCVKLTDDPNACAEVTAVLETSGAYLMDRDELDGGISDTLSGFLSLSRVSLIAALVLSVVGCVNAYASQYLSRKQERVVLRGVGMSRKLIRRAYLLEILLAILCSTAVGVLIGSGLIFILDCGMQSFGCTLIG